MEEKYLTQHPATGAGDTAGAAGKTNAPDLSSGAGMSAGKMNPAGAPAGTSRKRAARERAEFTPPYTAFTDQPVRLLCTGYECTDRGVRTAAGRQVCLHPILPVGAIRNADGGDFSMELAFCTDLNWETRVYPFQLLASAAGILELAAAGIAVTNENARALSTYLTTLFHLNTDVLKVQRGLSRLGWLSPTGREFAPYSDNVRVDCAREFREKLAAVRFSGTEDSWMAAVKDVWVSSLPARLTLAASFGSALLGPLELQPFFFHLWGKTGLGKTVLLQLAASVWGDPRPGKLISTFNATSVGLETTAAFLHDIPLCIDELQILSAAGKNDFQQTVYLLSEGVGRVRGAKDGGLRSTLTWRNVMITTGERPLNTELSGGGAVNRAVELELEAPVTEDFGKLLEGIGRSFGVAGFRYVLGIDAIRSELKGYYTAHLQALLEKGVTGKQAAAMAVLLLADETARWFFFGDADVFPEITYEQAAALLVKEADVCAEKRAVNYLFDTVAANPAKFPEAADPHRNLEVWGKPAGEYVAVIGSVFDKLMRDAGFDPRAVLSYAHRQGLLQTEKDHWKRLVRFGCRSVRCIVIKPEESEDVTGVTGVTGKKEIP